MDNMNIDLTEPYEQAPSPHSPNFEDIFGNSMREPRVGDEFQAQIPPLVIDCCCEDTNLEITSNLETDFYIGLPVPITWVKDTSLSPLPLSPTKTWDPIDHESFVLGLYIFGRNLKNVKKFVKSKKMGDILAYYYGKFYRSSEYNQWSMGKKMKSKGCIRGEKIFAGWRREELLSRLSLDSSEEMQSSLREINTKYEENNISLEEYVLKLRRIVGLKALVEAIAIGKGKRDLTLSTSDPKSTQNFSPNNPKIPKKKVFSSLTAQEISHFLTEVNLSKARLRDLFWEAVWPRLLANGWHSEQPKGYAILIPKRSILFILPGIEKFSRREHIKGTHYFDSVTDILDKVVSDPSLLERKEEEKIVNDENEMDLEIVENSDKFQEFTIVDTSLRLGRERLKVVEKRILPNEAADDISFLSHFRIERKEKLPRDDKCKKKALVQPPKLIGKCSVEAKLSGDDTPCDKSAGSDENVKSQELETNVYEEDDCSERKSRALVELNLPQLPRELKANGKLDDNAVDDHEDSGIDTSTKVAPSQANEQCSNPLTSRRQSTRCRPLTTKVLEAIADGLLSPNRKRRNVEKNG